jgi:hypothetical protein
MSAQRLDRLPPFARRLISDRGRAQAFLASAPLARQMFAAGLSPTQVWAWPNLTPASPS